MHEVANRQRARDEQWLGRIKGSDGSARFVDVERFSAGVAVVAPVQEDSGEDTARSRTPAESAHGCARRRESELVVEATKRFSRDEFFLGMVVSVAPDEIGVEEVTERVERLEDGVLRESAQGGHVFAGEVRMSADKWANARNEVVEREAHKRRLILVEFRVDLEMPSDGV